MNASVNKQSAKLIDTDDASSAPVIRGLDIHKGLVTVFQNPKLFQKALTRFAKRYQSFIDDFNQAERLHCPEDKILLAHNLKGSASNVGATALAQAASKLESACLNNLHINLFLAEVSNELQTVLAGVAGYLDSVVNEPQKATAYLSEQELQKKLHELQSLLQDSNTKAIEESESLLNQVQSTTQISAIKQIVDKMEDFDFDAALHILKTQLLK